MWNWIKHGVTRSSAQQLIKEDHTFDATHIQAWLQRIIQRYAVHPDHQNLLQEICRCIGDWHQVNRRLTLQGNFRLNTIPLFPPTWFANKSRQNRMNCEGLAPSYLATFVPPYRLLGHQIPERWDQVFLKGLTVDQNHKVCVINLLVWGNVQEKLIHSLYYVLFAIVQFRSNLDNFGYTHFRDDRPLRPRIWLQQVNAGND